ncbi:MAG: 50S ribosomal protein L37e [Candidatus Aenigmarchaeota archaeon]|nr:50S ribosomal protein L37e [Candidatus Aenigmarchaeota archaeon]
MVKGTASKGKHQKITHIRCRRCGRHSYHIRKSKCSACGFGKSRKMKNENWKWKTVTRSRRKDLKIGRQKVKTARTF